MKIMPEKEVPARRAAGKTWQGADSRLRQQGEWASEPVHESFQTSSVLQASCTSGQARARRARRVHVGPGACTCEQSAPSRRARGRSLPFCYMLTCASRRAPS